MRTNIDIDDKLMAEVMKITKAKTKKAAVHEALTELARVRRLRRAFKKVHGIGWEGNLEEMRRGRQF